MDQSSPSSSKKEEKKRGESSKGTTAEEKTHQRQSSTISADDGNMSQQSSNSPPLPPTSAATTPISYPQSPTLYMSSASSSSKSPMLTIDTVGDAAASAAAASRSTQNNKSDFFVAYDSDTSGSSFIHQQHSQGEQLSMSSSYGSSVATGQSHGRPRRDRFPSFDSHTSQGSIRYVSPRSQPKPTVNPNLLPYHERKKLQQQQQQQQQPNLKQPPNQQQQQQQQVPPQGPYPPNMMLMMPPLPPVPGHHPHMPPYGNPPPPVMDPQAAGHHHPMPPYGNPPPPVMDPQAAAAAFYSIYGIPPPHQPPHPHGFPSPPQVPHPAHAGFPPGFMMPPPPMSQGGGQPQPQQQHQQQQQRGGGGVPPPNPPFLQPYPMPFYPPPNLPQQFPQHQHQPQHPHAYRRSSQNSNASSSSRGGGGGGGDRQPHLSLSRKAPPQSSSSAAHHARADSYGSMSSLGSIGDGGADSESERSTHRRQNSSSSGSGFFADMFGNNMNNNNRNQQQYHQQQYQQQQEQQQPFAMAAAAAPPPSPFSRLTPRGGAVTDSPRSSRNHHRRASSQDRPPASRGTHKRLPSISNDEWGEETTNTNDDDNNGGGGDGNTSSDGGAENAIANAEDRDTIEGGRKYVQNTIVDENSSFSEYSSSDATSEDVEANERTSLLPPSGISTNEQEAANDSRKMNRASVAGYNSTISASDRHHHQQQQQHYGRRVSDPSDRQRRSSGSDLAFESSSKPRKSRRKKKKSSRRRSGNRNSTNGDSNSSASSDSSYDYRRWTMKRARMLEKEREQVHRKWKAEYLAETERVRHEREEHQLHRRLFRGLAFLWAKGFRVITTIEMFIANLPAAIGAIAMAVAILGVVWFKFTEENLQTCERVHFHSSQCTFPEFPGCFYCDTTVPMYQVAVNFHYGCNVVAGILAFMFVAKVLLATRVVIDEMASPVTASPAGLLCMTTVCVFAGRGMIGQIMVSLAASVHLGLVIWYIYMALAYQIMPEPTWFPNTIGIGLTAVKTWLYYPMPGHLLMAISLSLNIFFFPISLIRVAINEKISATVGWMQMSAPAVSLYALTIMAQPSFEEENPDVTSFQRVHRMIYLPCMHFMCGLSLIGFFASCHSLWSRWDDLKKRPFSPAHSAFCFPTLSHANAIQSYRGAVLTFSEVKPHDWRLIILYAYWFVVLLGGTIATFWISAKFLYNLPVWTNLDLADEEEPPAPSETILSLQEMITAGETMRQPFVSPAVLQANETGALVAIRTGPEGRLKYVRTRRLLALGFEPTMKWSEMQKEREVLLEWVGKNPPRRRHRTLSVPGIDFSYGSTPTSAFGTGNRGIYGGYGSFSPLPPARRSRADSTMAGW